MAKRNLNYAIESRNTLLDLMSILKMPKEEIDALTQNVGEFDTIGYVVYGPHPIQAVEEFDVTRAIDYGTLGPVPPHVHVFSYYLYPYAFWINVVRHKREYLAISAFVRKGSKWRRYYNMSHDLLGGIYFIEALPEEKARENHWNLVILYDRE